MDRKIKPGDILTSNQRPGFNWSIYSIEPYFLGLRGRQIEDIKANLVVGDEWRSAYVVGAHFRVVKVKGGHERALVRVLNGKCAGKYIDLNIRDDRFNLTGSDPDDNY